MRLPSGLARHADHAFRIGQGHESPDSRANPRLQPPRKYPYPFPMLSEIDTRPPFPSVPPSAFNLAGHVLARAASLGDKPALTILPARPCDETLSYGELLRLTQGCCHGAPRLGLAPGDRILLRLGNTPRVSHPLSRGDLGGSRPRPDLRRPHRLGDHQTRDPRRPQAHRRRARHPPPRPPCAGPRPRPLRLGQPSAPAPSTSATRTARPMSSSPPAPPAPRWPSATPTAPSLPARPCTGTGRALTEADRLLHAGALNWTYTLGTGLLDPWTVGAPP
jgi:hypothetical protein